MKLSIATLSLSAFLPLAMGDGLDESCFFMTAPLTRKLKSGERRLDGENFFINPEGEHGLDCNDHSTITAAGFTKYNAEEVCANLVDHPNPSFPGETLPTIHCDNTAPTQCGRDCEASDPDCVEGEKLCLIDIHWTCKEHFEDESSIIKAVLCGTSNACKLGFATCALDPHFKTWESADSWYDYHGQCDLKFMSDPKFMGTGLEIDIRTKARYDYSYIESAAVKLGEDTFEISSYGDVIYNGVEGAAVDGMVMADLFKIKHTMDTKIKQAFMIHIHQDQYIELSNFKDMVSVKVHNATARVFGNTVGMMGDFEHGRLTSRDGSIEYNIKDQDEINAFGQEWQVLASEPNLFQTPSDPSAACVLPSKTAAAQRRLAEHSITEEAARLACANSDHEEMCVYDVMATGDLELASAGVY